MYLIRHLTFLFLGFLLVLPEVSRADLTAKQKADLPPSLNRKVSFSKDIYPLLEKSCTKCHGKGKAKGGFSLETREKLLSGGDSGLSVVLGKSDDSYLVELISGIDPENVMPQKGSKFTAEQVGLIRAWIDQGVEWESNTTFAKAPVLNLKPRRPNISGAKNTHPIDLILEKYFAKFDIHNKDLVSDKIFARRVYLDTIGLLPPIK